MVIKVTPFIAKEQFKAYNRDYFSLDAIESILDFYDECGDSNKEFDVIEICGSWTEYGDNATCSFDDFINDYKDVDTDLENLTKKEKIQTIIEDILHETIVFELNNGNILVMDY